jgi:hypothetical protein
MKNLIFLILFILFAGCSQQPVSPPSEDIGEMPVISVAKNDDSSVCAYWKCSTTGKLYMQKYVKDSNGNYSPAGAYKLGEGVGAFPLADLDKYGSDGNAVSVDNGANQCPWCGNLNLVGCQCGKTYCEKADATEGTCPWCKKHGHYKAGSWNTGGGG